MVPVEEGPRDDGRLALDHGRVVLDDLAALERLLVVDVLVPLAAPLEHGAVDVLRRHADGRLRDERVEREHRAEEAVEVGLGEGDVAVDGE